MALFSFTSTSTNQKDEMVIDKKYQEKLSKLRITLDNKKQIPIDFLDVVYMFERIAKSWADVVDLVQPIYNE